MPGIAGVEVARDHLLRRQYAPPQIATKLGSTSFVHLTRANVSTSDPVAHPTAR